MPSATTEAFFVEGYQPGYIGRIVELHGSYYSQKWGSGAQFESLMAIELSEFCQQYQPDRDLLLTAHRDDELIGSIAVHGSQSPNRSARLRWFILDATYRGRGIGREMLNRSLAFCRTRSFDTVYLWTTDKLPASRHLYESVGFRVVEQVADSRYGIPLLNLKMEMDL